MTITAPIIGYIVVSKRARGDGGFGFIDVSRCARNVRTLRSTAMGGWRGPGSALAATGTPSSSSPKSGGTHD
ncbi:hypothetical protein GS421_07630 [Rhodococcus hoagii]|nr:hypothetical protein [Prescottella equi]